MNINRYANHLRYLNFLSEIIQDHRLITHLDVIPFILILLDYLNHKQNGSVFFDKKYESQQISTSLTGERLIKEINCLDSSIIIIPAKFLENDWSREQMRVRTSGDIIVLQSMAKLYTSMLMHCINVLR